MQTSVLASTVFLTLLLAIGLFFFIRASTKDRIEVAQLVPTDLAQPQSQESLLASLQQYFTDRAYRIAAVDPDTEQVRFEGMVRPSVFLAVFLTSLAAIGILCLVLVLAILFPNGSKLLFGLVGLAPVAGLFYWRKSERPEQVVLKIETVSEAGQAPQPLLTVTAHRDELAELQRSLALKPIEEL